MSAWQLIHMKWQDLFSMKIKKERCLKMPSAAVVIGTLLVRFNNQGPDQLFRHVWALIVK